MAAFRNVSKYCPLLSQNHFVPLALETLDPKVGLTFITELERRELSRMYLETQEKFQRLSIVIQRFNAVAFQSTFALTELDEV